MLKLNANGEIFNIICVHVIFKIYHIQFYWSDKIYQITVNILSCLHHALVFLVDEILLKKILQKKEIYKI